MRSKIKKISAEISREAGQEPTIEEIADWLIQNNEASGSKEKLLEKLHDVISAPVANSLDKPRDVDDDEVNLYDIVADANSDIEDMIEESGNAALLNDIIIRAKLSEREKQILEMRAEGKTLDAVGIEIGITRERVRQIEKVAIIKCRKAAQEIQGEPV
jgi:RNA polymerase sigma factor (sigma-70 family)